MDNLEASIEALPPPARELVALWRDRVERLGRCSTHGSARRELADFVQDVAHYFGQHLRQRDAEAP